MGKKRKHEDTSICLYRLEIEESLKKVMDAGPMPEKKAEGTKPSGPQRYQEGHKSGRRPKSSGRGGDGFFHFIGVVPLSDVFFPPFHSVVPLIAQALKLTSITFSPGTSSGRCRWGAEVLVNVLGNVGQSRTPDAL